MPNVNAPNGTRYSGWFRDDLNSRLEFYYNGTKVGHIDASGMDITDDTTARMTDGLLQNAGIATDLKRNIVKLGSMASLASDGANAISKTLMFVAPASFKIVSAWRINQSKSDVTKGTATTSASYRRVNLITNTGGAGSGTNIVASQEATASAASLVSRSFATVASTVPIGAIIAASHLTVGAATAAGTDMAESDIWMEYELV